jgi:hypothetical protein
MVRGLLTALSSYPRPPLGKLSFDPSSWANDHPFTLLVAVAISEVFAIATIIDLWRSDRTRHRLAWSLLLLIPVFGPLFFLGLFP